MMRYLIAALVAVFSYPAIAAQCFDRESVIRNLAEGYMERQVARGLSQQGHILEIWATEGGETWTILLTPPGSEELACPADSGEALQLVAPPLKGRGS